MSHLVVTFGEKASGVLAMTDMLHSGARNPFVPTGIICTCQLKREHDISNAVIPVVNEVS